MKRLTMDGWRSAEASELSQTVAEQAHNLLDRMIAWYDNRTTTSTTVEKTATSCPKATAPQAITKVQKTGDIERASLTKTAGKFSVEDIRRKWERDDERLRMARWSDRQLAQIENEELAGLAFDTSDPLKTEFHGEKSAFLAYWRSVRHAQARISSKLKRP